MTRHVLPPIPTFLILVLLRVHVVDAAAPGDLDPTFDAGSSINATNTPVLAIAGQSDGKIVIGGEFTSVRGAARGRLARLNVDGSNDGTFMNGLAGFDGKVQCVAVQPDGKILAGGWFLNVNGVARSRIARLNANGTLDNTFQNVMTGVTGGALTAVYCLALQSDGKILIGRRLHPGQRRDAPALSKAQWLTAVSTRLLPIRRSVGWSSASQSSRMAKCLWAGASSMSLEQAARAPPHLDHSRGPDAASIYLRRARQRHHTDRCQ